MTSFRPESYVLHRTLGQVPPRIAYGRGVYLFDADGKDYLDASGGAAVSCLGHGDGEIADAVARQMQDCAYVHSGFFTSNATEELAETLVHLAGGDMRAALFFSSGSEAMEAALKLARQYHLERGEPARTHIISRRYSYHGTTLGALGIGGLTARKAPFAPWLATDSSSLVSPCYPYRFRNPDEDDHAYSNRLALELEAEIERIGPGKIAAFVAETVAGATIGVVPPVEGYFRRIREICDRHGILLILDEVMCGMGRCGAWLAYHDDGIAPDIACVAKGLGGGFQPIGAMIVNRRTHDTLASGSRIFKHGQTYMGHATASAASLAVLQKIQRLGLINGVRSKGALFDRALRRRLENHPHVGDIRGRGLFRAVELVVDRESKSCFPTEAHLHARIKSAAMANGLLCYPGGGALDGVALGKDENGNDRQGGDHVLLAPPFIATRDQLEEIAARLTLSIDAAIADAKAGTPQIQR